MTTDKNGYAKSSILPVGNYTVKEISASICNYLYNLFLNYIINAYINLFWLLKNIILSHRKDICNQL
ncbi:MAG: prealbumin-like fold domain-containing protein [Faecalibacillus intestinalis]|uniref:prealbumin-like fold domain-containing protein n=1 Tax=Faecalibacillus intestinalis TaxID=1982626 RepID=UPI00384FF658